jgi:hypothetical protein
MLLQHTSQVFSPLVNISTFHAQSIGGATFRQSAGVASAAYPSANLAIYIPFRIDIPITVTNLYSYNGSAVSGNIDIGIYNNLGGLIVSKGTTAQAGTSAIQTFSITATSLTPGQYYLAVAMDNTTGTLFTISLAQIAFLQVIGMAQQATAFVLPSTATFASSTNNYIPCIGLTTRSFV